MFYRKDAVSLAVLSLLASTGFAMADGTQVKTTGLSLNPAAITADEAPAPRAPLMWGLDKVGAAKPLDDIGLNIYGWLETGYTYNHRDNGTPIAGGTFTQEVGNHYAVNQLVVRFERQVDSKKWDVGGMVELMYGTDANFTRSNGLLYENNNSASYGDANGAGGSDNRGEVPVFDITQAYVDVNVPVGNGLKFRAGKFVTFLSYETIDPRNNPFYSRSLLFSQVPATQTGLLAFYTINDQWQVAGGITRGWDQATEDNNGSVDTLGQVIWTPNKQWTAILNGTVGPEDSHDSSHYRVAIDPVVTWRATDKLKLGGEALYIYDGGAQGNVLSNGTGFSHAYGDVWGAALYASYNINEYFTANVRAEKLHQYLNDSLTGLGNQNFYEITLGVTIVPLPKDPLGQNIIIRPEVRYDFSEDKAFSAGNNSYKDQLTFAADIILKF